MQCQHKYQFGKGSEQYDFVVRDLQNAESDPNIDWIIIFYHRLAYSSPAQLDSLPKFRNVYHPLFEKYNVDLVIQGHSHNYKRSFPIKYNSMKSNEPLVTDYEKDSYQNPNGQIFMIVGTGGANDIHEFTAPPSAHYTAAQFNAYGFFNIDVLENGTKLVGGFYDNDGTLKDRFSISKPKLTSNQSSSLVASSHSTPRLVKDFEGKFDIEAVFRGLQFPTDMAFLDPKDPNDIIVLEKDKGTVQRIVKGELQDNPVLDVNVSTKNERGLLGTR